MPAGDMEESGARVGCDCAGCERERREYRQTIGGNSIATEIISIEFDEVTVAPVIELVECERCGALRDENVRCACSTCRFCSTLIDTSPLMICSDCFSQRMMCSRCGLVYLPVELHSCTCGVENLCGECIRSHRDCRPTKIHSYSYKPPPQFQGSGPLYLGIELEVDRGRKDEGRGRDWSRNPGDRLDKIGELSDGNKLFYLKSDSSLSAGFEIVTHPCSLTYHQEEFPWQEVLERVKEIGLQSHDTETCGLHIHASRLGFGKDLTRQEMVLGRLMMLWNRHWWRYAQLSRRKTKELSSWCLPNREAVGVVEEDMVTMLETVKKPGSRSVAINTQPWEGGREGGNGTAEFRLFKGTLNYDSLMAALEIVHHSISISKSWQFKKIAKSRWGDVLADAEKRGYSYLTKYVQERGAE